MAWTAGADVIVGDLITAAMWNNYMGTAGSIQYLFDSMPAVRVFHNADQLIGDAARTILTFNSERFDTDGMHDGVNPTRLTATTGGKYLIIAHIQWDVNAVGRRNLRILLNGVTDIATDNRDALAVDQNQMISTLYDLSATDFVEVDVWQNSGGNLNVETQANWSPEFMMVKVG